MKSTDRLTDTERKYTVIKDERPGGSRNWEITTDIGYFLFDVYIQHREVYLMPCGDQNRKE